MNVGTNVDDLCITEFNNLKTGHAHRFIIYKIDEHNNIVIESIGAREASYQDFIQHLKPNEARYAVYDFQAESDDVPPMKFEKIVFVFWSPDTQPVKQKMAYAAGKEALKKKLQGLAKELQANDPSEVDFEVLRRLVLKN